MIKDPIQNRPPDRRFGEPRPEQIGMEEVRKVRRRHDENRPIVAHSSEVASEMVKVLDFGIAKFLPGSEDGAEGQTLGETDARILIGTPGYMSPEQLLGGKPAVSWDLWALAITAYETLTGSLPFPISSEDSWRQALLAGGRTPLTEHLTDPPAAWEEFFACSLAADWESRPHSAAEFLRHMQQALA